MRVGVLIGRLQVPEPHEGHRFLINRILENCDKLIILVGSANRARSIKNPFTYQERVASIAKSLKSDDLAKVLIAPLNDYPYNDTQWMSDVSSTVNSVLASNYDYGVIQASQVTLYGHFKPGNDYLKWFPQFKFQNIDTEIEVSGTEMRNSRRDLLPEVVQQEYAQYDADAKKFASYPYQDCLQSNCGDMVVECAGHVLLIQRQNGVWALPGGHKSKFETFTDCAIRECYEETNLKVPEKVLRGSIISKQIFDHPSRSPGFVPKVTQAVYARITLNPDGTFPKVKASDDAIGAKWVQIDEAINTYRLHDDHADIIATMTHIKPLMAINNPSIYGA